LRAELAAAQASQAAAAAETAVLRASLEEVRMKEGSVDCREW
jgi:hypothetical protein